MANEPAPRPHRFGPIQGQQRALATVRASLETARIPNAWLFAGPKGVGKFTTAMAAAAAINCREGEPEGGGSGGGLFGGGGGASLFGAPEPAPAPAAPVAAVSDAPRTEACGACASCRKIAASNHPDVRVVRTPPDKRVISIDLVRDVLAEFAYRPYEGRRRVVIVDGAEALTPQAANALLKTLEEPPPHSSWILVAESTSRLLPTVISRCRIVRFGTLPVEVAATLLAQSGAFDAMEARSMAAVLGGSIGRALGPDGAHYAREARAMVIDEALRVVRESGVLALEVAEGWDRREKQDQLPVQAALEHLAAWTRDLAVWQAAADPKRLSHADLLDRIEPIAGRTAPGAVARAYDAVRLCARDIQGNVNDKLALETMLLSLRRELAA